VRHSDKPLVYREFYKKLSLEQILGIISLGLEDVGKIFLLEGVVANSIRPKLFKHPLRSKKFLNFGEQEQALIPTLLPCLLIILARQLGEGYELYLDTH
jgi:hypothetical protein